MVFGGFLLSGLEQHWDRQSPSCWQGTCYMNWCPPTQLPYEVVVLGVTVPLSGERPGYMQNVSVLQVKGWASKYAVWKGVNAAITEHALKMTILVRHTQRQRSGILLSFVGFRLSVGCPPS